ncbi:hypothetical protein D3C77_585700 [compost metagenome]
MQLTIDPIIVDRLIAVILNANEQMLLISGGADPYFAVFSHMPHPVDDCVLDKRLQRNFGDGCRKQLRRNIGANVKLIFVPVLLQLDIGRGMLQLFLQCYQLPAPAQADLHQLGQLLDHFGRGRIAL